MIFDEEALRALFEESLHKVLDEREGDDPPPPPPVRRGRPLESHEAILLIDPAQPKTFNHERPWGQVWARGMYQRGEQTEYIATRISPHRSLGYGGTMDDLGNVRSWPMSDGTDLRYGAYIRDGKPMFSMKVQFRLRDGYHADGNVMDNGWRVNELIGRAPGESDPVTFDGSRVGQSAIGADLSVGPNAPTIVWGINLLIEEWMFSSSNIAAPFDLHEPGSKLSGPMILSIHKGVLKCWAKHSPSSAPLDYETATQGALDNITMAEIELDRSMIGQEYPFMVACRVDRTGANNYFEAFTLDDDYKAKSLATFERPYGYSFLGPKNDEFYPIVQVYQWHEWLGPDSKGVLEYGLPLWNHDDSHGDVYNIDFSTFTVSDLVGIDRIADHLAWHLTG